jgi:hypothetical protein
MSKNYMEDIYNVINAEEVEYNDQGIEYLDEPIEDDLYYEDELSWADNITYLDEPVEDEFELDLGEGFIPLPQGEVYQEELVIIDENYILDEFEEDLIDNYVKPETKKEYKQYNDQPVDFTFDEIYNLLDEDENDMLDLNNIEVESIINFGNNDPEEELKSVCMDDETSSLATSIAKEHLDNVKAGEAAGALFGDVENSEDDTSWVKDDDDIFGANIDRIIAEDPNVEVEEDFVEGTFEDWLAQQNQ